MKYIGIILILLALVGLIGCSSSTKSANDALEADESAVDAVSEETADIEPVKVDTDADQEPDFMVEKKDDIVEVTVPIENKPVTGEWCVPGSTYSYEQEDAATTATVIGMTSYKGGSFCQALSSTKIESPIGDIVTDTTYFFNADQSEFWITTTTTSPMMPEPQVNEVHIVDGEVA
ncbi:MAG: hypothetical protein KJ601_03005 [Nanoarchaeota archaeon]|nr:hypothetical protein [Nanoarchaeota archaeon]